MTDDLDPKALDAAWRAFDARAAGGADTIRDEPWFLPAIEAAVIAALPVPDRGETLADALRYCGVIPGCNPDGVNDDVEKAALTLREQHDALRDRPDRDEMVERGAKALWDVCQDFEVEAERLHFNRAYSPMPWGAADEYDRDEFCGKARAVLDAALGPATDQEREG